MKIAFCTFVSLSCYGGTEVRLAEMARLLVERGHDVKIYATPYSHGGRKVEPERFIQGIQYKEAWRHRIEADVAYIYYYSPLIWRMLFSSNCPKIAGLHPPGLLSKRSPRHYLFKLIGSQDLALFNAVRIQSPIFKFKHNQVFEIPDWVDTKHFTPQQQKAEKFTLLFVGRRHKDRRWDVFLEVASKLKAQGYDFEFIATGETSRLVKGLGTVSHENMREVYSRSHVLLQPSLSDTFGLVIVEALSCGIPVITTALPAHTSLGGTLFYAQSVGEFTKQVLEIYKHWRDEPESFQQLRHSLRLGVLKFDIDNVFPQLENMFENVVNQGKMVR